MRASDEGPQSSWGSREGFGEVVVPEWNLRSREMRVQGGGKEAKEAVPGMRSVELEESYVKWRGHGWHCHCIKGKARTSKRWGE